MRRHALRAIAFAGVVAGLWWTLRGVSGAQLVHALALTDVRLVAGLSLPLLAVGSVLRGARYGALLPALGSRPRFFDVWSSVMLSTAANNVLPLKAGELLRTRETVAAGVPLARVAVAQLTEAAVEAVSAVACATPAIASHLGFQHPALAIVGLLAIGVVVAGWIARRFRVEPRQLAMSLAWSFGSDLIEIGVIAVCLAGLGLPAGPLPSVMVFAAVKVAVALPSTPGNLGAFEAGAALPLVAIGVERDAAMAFALVYRAVQWLPLTLAGAVLWARRTITSPAARARAS
jgi:uncharacterized membrane protein YbhN (UPF0104 family)